MSTKQLGKTLKSQEINKLVLERGLSYSNACERVAGSEGVAKRTIERHTSNPSKTHDT